MREGTTLPDLKILEDRILFPPLRDCKAITCNKQRDLLVYNFEICSLY